MRKLLCDDCKKEIEEKEGVKRFDVEIEVKEWVKDKDNELYSRYNDLLDLELCEDCFRIFRSSRSGICDLSASGKSRICCLICSGSLSKFMI